MRARFGGVVVMVALAAVGCDSGSTPLTKEEWTRTASAICGDANSAFNDLIQSDFPTSPETAAPFLEKAVPIFERQLDRLRDLTPPEGDADEIETILELGEQGVASVEAAARDQQTAAELFSDAGGDDLDAFEQALADYGAQGCAPDAPAPEDVAPDPATFSPEKAAFIAAVTPVCEAATQRINEADDEFLTDFPPSIEGWSGLLSVLIPSLEEQAAGIEAAEPPAGDEAAVAAIVDQHRELITGLEELRAAADARDQAAVDALAPTIFEQLSTLGRSLTQYGLAVCVGDDAGE